MGPINTFIVRIYQSLCTFCSTIVGYIDCLIFVVVDNTDKYVELSEVQLNKLKLLTIVALAAHQKVCIILS
jgi:hypothetical protein